MGLLYPTMFKIGPENFGVVILEVCPKNTADARELFWIRKMGHTLNVRGVYPTDRRWKLLLNGRMVMPKYTKAQLARMTHHITEKLKCNVPIHVQLKILAWAKKALPGTDTQPLLPKSSTQGETHRWPLTAEPCATVYACNVRYTHFPLPASFQRLPALPAYPPAL
jgi:hypothetical protein